jgi:hypothetical protein
MSDTLTANPTDDHAENPLDRIHPADRLSIPAVLVSDGEDPGPALAEAGIYDPIALPVTFGEDEPTISFGDGITENLTAVLETTPVGATLRAQTHAARPAAADAGQTGLASANLPPAYGLRPLAPIGPRGSRRSVANVTPPSPRESERIATPRFRPTAVNFTQAASQNSADANRFFDQLDGPLSRLAKDLGLPEDYLLGLSAYESAYYNDHNLALNNPLGFTKAGANNIQFKSIHEALAYWKSQYGDQVRGATSAADFAQRLEGVLNGVPVPGWHRYNSANRHWEEQLEATINSIGRRKERWRGDR